MSGNHSHEDYYQPGALIYRDLSSLTAAFTSITNDGAFHNVDNGAGDRLRISYNPPVDVWALFNLSIRFHHSVADKSVQFRIYDGSASILAVQGSSNVGGTYRTMESSKASALTADTAYTIDVDYMFSDAGTVTVFNGSAYCYLEMIVFRKP